jgi:hypothetical protein
MGSALGLVAPRPSSTGPRVSLEAEVNLSNTPNQPSDWPQVVVTEDGTVHAVWREVSSVSTVVHRYLLPGATSWLPAASTTLAYRAQEPTLATNGDEVTVAFTRLLQDGSSKVLYRTWNRDQGVWGSLQPSDGTANGSQPDLAYDTNDPLTRWLVWIDASDGRQPVYLKLRGDSIQDGGTIDVLNNAPLSPQVAVAPEGDVHVAWIDEGPAAARVKYAWRPSGQTNWIIPESQPAAYYADVRQARAPDLAVDSGPACIVWQEDADAGHANQEIIRSCLPWDYVYNLSNSPSRSLMPRLALDPVLGSLIVWQERPTAGKVIRFSQATPPTLATVHQGDVDMPALAYHYHRDERQGYVHAVWVEQTSPEGGSDVYYGRWKVDPAVPTATATATASPTTPAPATAVPSATPSATATATAPPGSPTALPPTGPVAPRIVYCPWLVKSR